jgi:hypothetical protein
MFSFSGACWISLTDMLRWLDAQIKDPSLNDVKRQTFAWVQYNFDQLRFKPSPNYELRTLSRDGETYAETAGIKTWLNRHVQVTPDEWQCVEWVWKQVVELEDAQNVIDAADSTPDPEHVQIFADLMNPELVDSCCKLGVMMHLDLGRLTASYLHGDIAEPVKGRDIRGALRAVTNRLAANPKCLHYEAANEELGLKRPNPKQPLNQLAIR